MTRKNTAVYVTGLPSDVTIEEIKDYFSLCGVIMDDLIHGGPRIKLYTDDQDGGLKGDGLVVFLRPESVQLAVNLLDSSPLRPDHIIRVQPAEFHHIQNEEKEEEAQERLEEQKRLPLDKETWKRRMEQMTKRLDWREDEVADQRALFKQLENERIVIISSMFNPSDKPTRLEEVEQDALEECQKFGQCRVTLLEERGLIAIKFDSRERASMCKERMNGRLYYGKKLSARLHDGSFKIKKKSKKTDSSGEDERLEEFSRWLEQEEGGRGKEITKKV